MGIMGEQNKILIHKMVKSNIILLTGVPGVGKTTLIKRLIEDLKDIETVGFYTEEVRDPITRQRTGFDVITMKGIRERMARISSNQNNAFKVGRYTVDVVSFNRTVSPILKQFSNMTNAAAPTVLIVDEIGKMELLSTEFENLTNIIISQMPANGKYVIATLPVANSSHKLLKTLRVHKAGVLFTVTQQNRDTIYTGLLQKILDDFRC